MQIDRPLLDPNLVGRPLSKAVKALLKASVPDYDVLTQARIAEKLNSKQPFEKAELNGQKNLSPVS